MGLFNRSKKQPEPEPVRRDQVQRLARAFRAEDDAILFDVPGCPDYPRARAVLEAVLRNATPAEQREALREAYRD